MTDLEGIKQIEEQAKAMVESLKPLQEQANSIVESMKPIQTQIQEIASAVLPIQEGLEKEAHQLQKKVKPLYEKISTKLEEMNNLQEQVTEAMNKISDVGSKIQNFYDDTFSPIKQVVDDPENGLEKTYENAQDSLNEIVTIQEEIAKYKLEIETTKNFLDEVTESNKTLKENLENMLGVANDKSLSMAFDGEVKNIKRERRVWQRSFIGLLACFLLVSVWLVISFNGSIDDFFVTKSAFGISVLLVDIVLYREYSKYNKIIESYTFKKTIASTMNIYHDLLRSKFIVTSEGEEDIKRGKDIEDKILDFVLDTMKSIYKEPESDKSSELELKAKVQAYELSFKNSNSERNIIKKYDDISGS